MDKNELETKLLETFDSIKIGHSNAIQPPKGLEIEFAEYVDKKNLKGDIVINIGKRIL